LFPEIEINAAQALQKGVNSIIAGTTVFFGHYVACKRGDVLYRILVRREESFAHAGLRR
jgi:hypothetical protein